MPINIKEILTYYKDKDEQTRQVGYKILECITLQLGKCKFGVTELNILGHTINEKGILPEKYKILAKSEFPKPKNKKELRSFYGLCNFYQSISGNKP